MRIIIGLGNPGKKYKGTRHNVGFEAVDKLCFDHGIRMKMKFLRRAMVGEGKIGGAAAALVQPQTYMNLSGNAAAAISRYYKQPPSALIVVYDDISLELGEIRVRAQGSAGGQKGMAHIITRLGTQEIIRVRIGIGAKPEGWELSDYVLSRFKREEHDAFVRGVTLAGEAVECIVKEGVETAMGRFNRRKDDKR